MADARRLQARADVAIELAERALSSRAAPAALSYLRVALCYRPWDKLKVSPELQRAWDEQDIPPEVD